jgi:hypothetical protein
MTTAPKQKKESTGQQLKMIKTEKKLNLTSFFQMYEWVKNRRVQRELDL